MHDINDDKAPAKMLNLFQKTSNIHLYNACRLRLESSMLKVRD